MARKKRYRNPQWAKWQVFCNGAPVGEPVLAVSARQSIHVRRDVQTGPVLYGSWAAKQVGMTLGESKALDEALAELDIISSGTRTCPDCGYPDPSPTAEICPSCESPNPENPD